MRLSPEAFEAGCTIDTAYPGTPGTEIMENIGPLYLTAEAIM